MYTNHTPFRHPFLCVQIPLGYAASPFLWIQIPQPSATPFIKGVICPPLDKEGVGGDLYTEQGDFISFSMYTNSPGFATPLCQGGLFLRYSYLDKEGVRGNLYIKKLYHNFLKREELFLSQNDISIV